jgi:hypothetical protein
MMDATNPDMQWSNTALMMAVILSSITACSGSPAARSEEKSAATRLAPEKSDRRARLARADRSGLQAKATAACECAVAKGKYCWANYKAAIEPFLPSDGEAAGAATACAPVSTETDCLKDADGDFCVTTGYYVNGVDLPERHLCQRTEAEALERAFNAEFEKPGGDQDRAMRAAKEALSAVPASNASKAPPTTDCCV